MYYFTPLPGYFSPFPHGTGSLSVAREYLALRGGPRGFRPGFPCPVVLRWRRGRVQGFAYGALTLCSQPFQACSATPHLCHYPAALRRDHVSHTTQSRARPAGNRARAVWADPLSLATTQGVEISFLSSGY